MPRITDFTELKAYIDIFNERGHKGFKEPINPFLYWNHKWAGRVDDRTHAFMIDGLVIILELGEGSDVNNMLVFALCPQKNILQKILDITKDYGTVKYNSEYRNRYFSITRNLDGDSWFSNGRFYYAANGVKAWNRSGSL